jgi:molybdate transport system substrate-binding protein
LPGIGLMVFGRRAGTAFLLTVAVFAAGTMDTAAKENSEIIVSAAVSLKNAFEELGALYERNTGVRVRLNLGASGLLQKQIEAGAPVDIFASAGGKQMDEIQARGLIFSETRRNLARNSIVLVVPLHSKISVRSFQELARPEVGRIAIGNPRTVPAGQYAQEALKTLNLWAKLEDRLILAENARQVLDYVVRGEVEAGIVYASDVSVASDRVTIADRAPKETHGPIIYAMAIIRGTGDRASAQRFIDLVLSDTGQAVLKKNGFIGVR